VEQALTQGGLTTLFIYVIQSFESGSGIQIQSGQWIRIRIQKFKNGPQKSKKLRNFMCWVFSFEG
jgi:hypothetical protein